MALSTDHRPSAPQRVQAALSAAGVATRIEEFPSSTRTAQEAADAVGTSVGQIVKSLVFLGGGVPILALVSGANRLDPSRLGALTGLEIGKADADAVRRATGYSIGGVPPTGFPAPIPTFVSRLTFSTLSNARSMIRSSRSLMSCSSQKNSCRSCTHSKYETVTPPALARISGMTNTPLS